MQIVNNDIVLISLCY